MSYDRNRRRSLLAAAALISGMLSLSLTGPIQAQDMGGLLNLFGARVEPARPQPQPQYNRAAPRSGYYAPSVRYRSMQQVKAVERAAATERFEQSYRSRRTARTQEPRSRYAALPKAKPAKEAKDKLTGETHASEKFNNKQIVDQKAINADPTAAILRDPTLRSGDIVVTSDGPKVFTGSTGKKKATGIRHRLRDFADVKTSKVVDKRTRQLLLAMMAPVGALPAHEAQKYLAKMKKIAPDDEIAPIESAARTDAPRIIVPWTTNASGLQTSAPPSSDASPAPKELNVKVSLPSTPKAPEDDPSKLPER